MKEMYRFMTEKNFQMGDNDLYHPTYFLSFPFNCPYDLYVLHIYVPQYTLVMHDSHNFRKIHYYI